MHPDEFRTEYEKCSGNLYGFLVRMTGDFDDAADILQEAVYRAYKNRKRFRGDSSFSTWLYRIAINVWKNQRKKAAHKVSMEMDQMPLIESETTMTPEKILAGKQAFSDISEALNLLDEKYRAPFLLRQIDGFSYREIADVMEIDENAARVRVYRARHTLRDMIGGE